MIDKEYQLDAALRALFRDIDSSPGFDASVMSQLQGNFHSQFGEQADRARQLERDRYRIALLEDRNTHRAKLRLLTFDGFGIACLVAVVEAAVWRHWDFHVAESVSDYYPYIAAVLGVLIAAVPVVGMAIERNERAAGNP
jgi:hypothetical protein